MKKLLAVLLALALCCAMVSAVAEEAKEDGDLTGTWYLSRAEDENGPITVVDSKAIMLTIYEGGKCEIGSGTMAGGVMAPATWTYADGQLTVTTEAIEEDEGGEPDNVSVFTYTNDDELKYEVGASVAYLSRTPAENAGLPAAVPQETNEAFQGTWIPSNSILFGLVMPVTDEMAGTQKLVIDGDKLSVMYDPGDGTFVSMMDVEVTLADGAISFQDPMMNSTVDVTLREDGRLYYHSATILGDMTTVFAPEAAEE